jgi:hypothetical protein
MMMEKGRGEEVARAEEDGRGNVSQHNTTNGQSIQQQHDATYRLLDVLHYAFQTLFKLAAELREREK